MLSPSFSATPAIAAVLLGILLVWLVVRSMRKDRREYSRFKRYRTTARRQRLYRKWVLESFLVFGGSALVVTALLWQHIPLFFDDFYALPGVVQFGHLVSDTGGMIPGFFFGATGALIVAGILGVFLARNSEEIPAIGDITALLPRNRAELRYGALLSLNAGVVEELLFRLAFPVLIFAVTDSAAIAVAASVALFGLLHVYQGASGVVGSLVIGTMLMAVFLTTGSILIAIVLHALIDLRSLVLIPVVVYRVHRVTGGAHRTTAPAAR